MKYPWYMAEFYETLRKLIVNLPDGEGVTRVRLDLDSNDNMMTLRVTQTPMKDDGTPEMVMGQFAQVDTEYKIVPIDAAFDAEYEEVGFEYLHGSQWRIDMYWNGMHATGSRRIYVRKELAPQHVPPVAARQCPSSGPCEYPSCACFPIKVRL